MSRICSYIKCPNRITIGHAKDPDVINYICPKCERINYVSETRKRKTKKTINSVVIFILSVTSVVIFVLYRPSSNSSSKSSHDDNAKSIANNKTAEKTLTSFFNYLNNKNYKEAYGFSYNSRWQPYSKFQEALRYWNLSKLESMKGKSYYSPYQADTIINMVYSGTIDATLVEEKRDFDFHLKDFNGEWRIIRIWEPRDPEIDALRKNEIPKNSLEAVNNFLDYLDTQLYKKAFLLTNKRVWGNQSRFLKDWGCISNITKYEVSEYQSINANKDKVYVKYYAEDPCHTSDLYEFYFIVSNENEYWKITQAMNP